MVTTTTYPMHDGSSMHGGDSSSFFAAYNEGKIIDGMPQLSIPVIGLFSKKSDYETLLRNLFISKFFA